MKRLLEDCNQLFGEAPREFSLWSRLTYFRVPKPTWLHIDPTDGLAPLFKNIGRTFSNGVVVWGHVVQANALLFKAGDVSCPGELVYSINGNQRIEVEDLRHIAHSLYSLKGTEPSDPELLSISNNLTNERIRVYGLEVPRSISPRFACKISTTYFVRKHLPGGRLRKTLLPIIVNPVEPHYAMSLPGKYWADEFLSWWME